jgi:hypothetical protein
MAISGQRAAAIVRRAINNTAPGNNDIKREDTLSDLGIGDVHALDLLEQNILYSANYSSVRITGNLNLKAQTTYYELYRQVAEKGDLIAA